MEIDVVRQFGELMDAFGLKLKRISKSHYDSNFDGGLRNSLYGQYDCEDGIRKMEEHYQENILYMVKDIFETHYVSFLLPKHLWENEEKEFIQIGPYIIRDPEELIDPVMEKGGFPLFFRKELKEYYYGIPLVKTEELLEAVILNQVGYILGGHQKITVNRIENVNVERFSMKKILSESDEWLSMPFIEERYQYEDRMLKAIKTGNLEMVMEVYRHFSNYRIQPRSEDNLRNAKNWMVIQNTLYRKAV